MASRRPYQAVFATSAVEFFAGLSRRRQRRLLERVRELAGDPFVVPDFQSEDAVGRVIAHLVVEDFIFDFWVDHAVRQLIVLDIDEVE